LFDFSDAFACSVCSAVKFKDLAISWKKTKNKSIRKANICMNIRYWQKSGIKFKEKDKWGKRVIKPFEAHAQCE